MFIFGKEVVLPFSLIFIVTHLKINKMNTKIEKWAPCVGKYGKYYEVSSKGKVRSKDRLVSKKNGARFLKVGMPRKIYWNNSPKVQQYYVTFCINGHKNKGFQISKLVAIAFCPNPHKYKFLKFIDGNSRSFGAQNLMWVQFKVGKQGSITLQSVKIIRELYNDNNLELKKIATLTNVTPTIIANIVYGNSYRDKNYIPNTFTFKRMHNSKGNSKVTPNQVRSIRNSDLTNAELAEDYGLKRNTIQRIKARTSWKNVK